MIRLLCPAAVLLVVACSSLPPAPVTGGFWRLDGKLLVRTAEESRVLRVRWEQRGESGDIRLRGPLGVGAVRISITPEVSTIDDGRTRRSFDPRHGLRAGGRAFDLPWLDIAWWARGYTGPRGEVIAEAHSSGDWTIRVLKRDGAGPRLLELSHPEVYLRLQVRAWSGRGPFDRDAV